MCSLECNLHQVEGHMHTYEKTSKVYQEFHIIAFESFEGFTYYLFERQRDEAGKHAEIFLPLVHSPNVHSSRHW